MSSNTFEVTLNLKIITRLRAHDRLDTTTPIFRIHTNNMIPQWLYRWWNSSNRAHDISRIEALYASAFEILETSDRDRIEDDLQESVSGLKALLTTYDNDATTQARLDVIIDNINRMLNQD